MYIFQTFIVGFAFSFIGSIPLGSINISVVQLSLNRQFWPAVRFAMAAALIEYPYLLIAVKLETWITSSPMVIANLQLIVSITMFILGIINLTSSANPGKYLEKFQQSGFRKGLLISIVNPLAIPFWMGITAYLQSNQWIDIMGNNIYIYALAISLGTFTALVLIAVLAKIVAPILQHSQVIKKLPGWIFIGLGLYAFSRYLITNY